MAAKSKEPDEPRRLNRVVGVAEALQKALDPAMRKRGFASRDIITHWAAMAPVPYDKVALPDKLSWPRGERGAEGATLYLRCMPGHALALSHEGQKIAASINRYFGYLLVGNVRISLEPMTPYDSDRAAPAAVASPGALARVEGTVDTVGDEGIRQALRRLGAGIMAKGKR